MDELFKSNPKYSRHLIPVLIIVQLIVIGILYLFLWKAHKILFGLIVLGSIITFCQAYFFNFSTPQVTITKNMIKYRHSKGGGRVTAEWPLEEIASFWVEPILSYYYIQLKFKKPKFGFSQGTMTVSKEEVETIKTVLKKLGLKEEQKKI